MSLSFGVRHWLCLQPWKSCRASSSLHACSVLSDLCHPMDCQVPLSMIFFRQEYWSGLPFSSPGILSIPGIKPTCPALQVASLPRSHLGSLLSSSSRRVFVYTENLFYSVVNLRELSYLVLLENQLQLSVCTCCFTLHFDVKGDGFFPSISWTNLCQLQIFFCSFLTSLSLPGIEES